MKVMHEYINEIISHRKKCGDWVDRKDLLSRFMGLTNEETGLPFDDDYLRDVVMNFFIAGRDTTACLLTWTFYMLSQHPEIEQRVSYSSKIFLFHIMKLTFLVVRGNRQ